MQHSVAAQRLSGLQIRSSSPSMTAAQHDLFYSIATVAAVWGAGAILDEKLLWWLSL